MIVRLQRLPLISFQRVEQYEPLRVMRQFGLRQEIPTTYPFDDGMHNLPAPSTTDLHWWCHLWIALWGEMAVDIPEYPPFDPEYHESVYMPWYRRITRLYIVHRTDPYTRGGLPAYVPRAARERGFVRFT